MVATITYPAISSLFRTLSTVEVSSGAFWDRLDKVDVSWLVDAETGRRKPEDNEMRYLGQFAIEHILTKSIVLYCLSRGTKED